jgi:hypothetical protein
MRQQAKFKSLGVKNKEDISGYFESIFSFKIENKSRKTLFMHNTWLIQSV